MDYINYYFNIFDIERNLYEPGELIEQNRLDVNEYIQYLAIPGKPDDILEISDNILKNERTGKPITYKNKVVDFTEFDQIKDKEWERLNIQFLNYHKAITIFDILNGMPFTNFVSLKSGLGQLKNIKVVDVGGGTGHTFCSFFHYPETIEYFLVDPNLRLVHDIFLRCFPKLSYLKLAHILSYAEQLPFKSNFADLVFSFSAIDHYKDVNSFIIDSYRILKPNGKIFICSHLDIKGDSKLNKIRKINMFSIKFLEKIIRFLYYRIHKVGKDDHTIHFYGTKDIENSLKKVGFEIQDVQIFKGNFYIIANKV